MISMELEERARQIIEEMRYITLATASKKGVPWITPVFAMHEKDFVFYWTSYPKSIHSVNIKENPEIAISIYNSKAEPGTGLGVYIKAKAHVVEDESEIDRLFKIFKKSIFVNEVGDVMGESPLRFYKAVPERFWVNCIDKLNGKYIDVRKEVRLLD
jgi:general stress protein 26